MNPSIGWGLAAAAVAAGAYSYGWQGAVMAVSAIVFWLLLQLSRALRVMKTAGSAPLGHVGNAVMLHAQLQPGMTLMQVITLTRSLGQRVSESPETWAWVDDGAVRLSLVFEAGKLARWELVRPSP